MSKLKILHVDENHPDLINGLENLGFDNVTAYDTPIGKIRPELHRFFGLIIRSRFPIDKKIINAATQLKFIARVGAGLENIDVNYANSKKIHLIAAPEGNQNAVGEHCLGMLLGLFNKLNAAHRSIQKGQWQREAHRGTELEGKTVGIIGYGNMGKSFARKLSGFNVQVLCHDIKANVGDQYATQMPLPYLQENVTVLSIHTPETILTASMIDANFIAQMNHPFWILNTARGSAVVTKDLVNGLKSGKILGAGLDVLECESRSFTSIFNSKKIPEALRYLLHSDRVLLSPHIAGWTLESHKKLANIIVEKIKSIQ